MRASDLFSSHLEFVLSQLVVENSYARAMAYLVSRALLSQTSGERQIDVGYAILKTTGLTSLEHVDDFTRGADNLQAVRLMGSETSALLKLFLLSS